MKRLHFHLYKYGCLVAMLFLTTSCLKDDCTDFSAVGTVVELPDAVPGGTDLVGSSVPYSTTPDSVLVRINVASPYPLDKELVVTLGVDQAALDRYNQTQMAA